MELKPPRLLLVDDNESDRTLASWVLEMGWPGIAIEIAGDALAFAQSFARGGFSVLVCERSLTWADGIKVMEGVRHQYPDCPVILFSHGGLEAVAAAFLRPGIDHYLPKSSAGFMRLPGLIRESLECLAGQREREILLPNLLEHLSVGILTLTGQGLVIDANPAVLRLLAGAGPTRLSGSRLTELFPDTLVQDRLVDFLQAEGPRLELDVGLIQPEAEPLPVRLRLWRVGGLAAGRILYQGQLTPLEAISQTKAVPSVQPVGTHRRDMEEFAYAASHDLQDPLGVIFRYGRLLAERYQHQLDEPGRHMLDTIVASTERMQDLLQGVADYAKVRLGEPVTTPVDFGVLLDDALANLQGLIRETHAWITQDPLPTLVAEARQIVQLLQNLIGNAIKYRSSEPPRIHVSASREDEHWLFAVRDNGQGIPGEHLERIFDLFQRLPAAEGVAGTGMGLALCRGIVERHGGTIWATSKPGRGSTFYFTLPGQDAGRLQVAEAHANNKR